MPECSLVPQSYSKGKKGLSLIVLQKVRKQGIRFWYNRTFWHEGEPTVGIKLL